jgi:hypothetical protein
MLPDGAYHPIRDLLVVKATLMSTAGAAPNTGDFRKRASSEMMATTRPSGR